MPQPVAGTLIADTQRVNSRQWTEMRPIGPYDPPGFAIRKRFISLPPGAAGTLYIDPTGTAVDWTGGAGVPGGTPIVAGVPYAIEGALGQRFYLYYDGDAAIEVSYYVIV